MIQNDKEFIKRSESGGIALANGGRYQHLVAVWLLVCEEVESIALETENDIAYPPGDRFSVYVQVKHRGDDRMWNSRSLTSPDENIFRLFHNNAETNPEAELWFVTDTAVETSTLQKLKDQLYLNDPTVNKNIMKRLQAQGLEVSQKTARLIDRLVIRKLYTCEFLTAAIERTLLAQGFPPDRTFGIVNSMVGLALQVGSQPEKSDRILSRAKLYQDCLGIAPPKAFTFSNLKSYCDQMVTHMRDERPLTAWDEKLFVPRQSFIESFDEFLQAPQPVFILAGESGTGKSFICSWLAEEYLKDSLRVFWNASDLIPDKPILTALAEELNMHAEVSQDESRWLVKLSNYAATTGKPFFILIDEINRAGEVSDLRNFRRVLLQAARRFEGRKVKLFLTCRTPAWEHFAETDWQRYAFIGRQPREELHGISDVISEERNQLSEQPLSPVSLMGYQGEPFGHQLMNFTDAEFEGAKEKYLAPRGIHLEIRGRARELLSHPLYLRLYSESIEPHKTGILESLEQQEVLEQFICFKLRQISQEARIPEETVEEFIFATATNIVKNERGPTSRNQITQRSGFTRTEVDQLTAHCIEIGLLEHVPTISGGLRFVVEELFLYVYRKLLMLEGERNRE